MPIRQGLHQQHEDRTDQLAGCEHQSPPMVVLAALGILAFIVGRILSRVSAQAVGAFNQVIAQIGIALGAEVTLLGGKVAGLLLGPPQAGKLGHRGLAVPEGLGPRSLALAVILAARHEALRVLDLGDDAPSADGAQAIPGLEGLRRREVLQGRGQVLMGGRQQLLQAGDLLQELVQGKVDGDEEFQRHGIRVLGYAEELTGIVGGVREAALAQAI